MGTLGAQAGLEEGRGQMGAQGQSSKKGARWPAVQPDLCQRRLPCQATRPDWVLQAQLFFPQRRPVELRGLSPRGEN